ncbi:antitoxin [Streptomyces sp. NPDC021093]|uniref:antitoxin n=1 Tax=Streptomyces sp. NPDC021093 TaxID=3365112 RepID=UPI003787EFFD
MGIFDKFKDQARDKAKDITDAAGDEVDEKTGGKYADKVDKAQQKAEDVLGLGDKKDDPAP